MPFYKRIPATFFIILSSKLIAVWGSDVKGLMVRCSGTSQTHIKWLHELLQGKTSFVSSSLRRLHGGGGTWEGLRGKQDVEKKS